jgi:hypothetical protein
MYFTLFSEISDVIEALQKVRRDVEEMYIVADEPVILPLF